MMMKMQNYRVQQDGRFALRSDEDPPIPIPPGEDPPPPIKEPPDTPVITPDSPVREPGPQEPRRL